ncbi:MAG: diguanylate cyclase, partial [Sulfurimonas sp.]|nr:diguanylate cyclase [Sulfurimonas sp.]
DFAIILSLLLFIIMIAMWMVYSSEIQYLNADVAIYFKESFTTIFFTIALIVSALVWWVLLLQENRHLVEDELAEKNELLNGQKDFLHKLTENVPGAIYQFQLFPDGKSSFPYASSAILNLYEIESKDVQDGKMIFDRVHKDDLAMVVSTIKQSASSMQEWHIEHRIDVPIKGVRWVEAFSKPEKLKDGSILWYGYVYDITKRKSIEDELKKQRNKLYHLANHDQLTGLPNRVLFYDRLKQAIEQAKRNSSKIALLFIDLDHFKEINDSLGHNIGDEILKAVAKRLSEIVRAEDTVARLGGDEFTVILKGLNQGEDVSLVAAKIVESLAKSIQIEEKTLFVSSSIGISIYPDDATSLQDLLKYADVAMYKAKDAGRSNFQYYNNTELL